MKCLQTIAWLLIFTLLVNGCTLREQKDRTSPPEESLQESAGVYEEEPSQSIPDDSLPQEDSSQTTAQVNRAIARIANFASMQDDAVLAVKNYYYNMGWMEFGEITHLERYYPLSDGAYFLIVPRFVHSDIVVETMEFRDGDFSPGKITYEKKDTPDDFALVLDTIIPEGGPALRVTVMHGRKSGQYNFTVGQSGMEEYPMVKEGAFLTEAAATPLAGGLTEGIFYASVDYGHAGFGNLIRFSVQLPPAWSKAGDGGEFQTFAFDGGTVKMWGYYEVPGHYTIQSFLLGSGNEAIPVEAGKRTMLRTRWNGSSPAVSYAFQAGDLIVMLEVSVDSATSAEYALDAAAAQIAQSFSVLGTTAVRELDLTPNI